MNGFLSGHRLVRATETDEYKGYGDRLVSRDVTAYRCQCGEAGVGGNDWTEARISFLEHTVQLISLRLDETVTKPPRDIDPVMTEAGMIALLRETGPLKINDVLSRMKAAGHSQEHISGAFIALSAAHRVELSHDHYLSIAHGGE